MRHTFAVSMRGGVVCFASELKVEWIMPVSRTGARIGGTASLGEFILVREEGPLTSV